MRRSTINLNLLKRRALDGSLLLAVAVVMPLLVMRSQLPPTDLSLGVALVYPPWTSARDAIEKATGAGGALMRMGAVGFVVVVRPDDRDAVRRMLAGGAWLALDPRSLGLCSDQSSS